MVKGRAALSANCRLQCYIRMTLWKCITFFSTQPFQPSSKAPLLHCYRNTSRGEFDLCAFPMSPPSLSSSVEHNFSLSHRLPATVSLRWPPDDPPLVAHSNTRGRDAPAGNISTQEGEKQKYVALFFFFHLKIFYLRINVLYKVTFRCTASAEITHTQWKTSSVSSMLYSYISCQTNKRSENHK